MKETGLLAFSIGVLLLWMTPAEAVATTCDSYFSYSEEVQLAYVTGMSDAALFDSAKEKSQQSKARQEGKTGRMPGWLVDCIGGKKTNADLKAIFDKYLRANPEKASLECVMIFYPAMVDACSRKN